MRLRTFVLGVGLVIAPAIAHAATLEVGPNKPYTSLQAALAAAKKGDEISVFTTKKSTAYDKSALLIKTPGLNIHPADPNQPITINGGNFDYSGSGKIPRAIFQFDKGADGCTLQGFELSGAHNNSHNGAAVRINQANNITIKNCTIKNNDMGIMSNGEVKDNTGANQLIEFCLIEKNGSDKEPGYNHNLYLGGASATVRGCEIAFSTTGHNLKSRAHHNWIEYNFIHDAANRELDLVDAGGNTDIPNSDSVLLGNIIRKAPNMNGNKTVIHFGKDGKADHTGTLWLVHNTITSDYISPIIDLSSPNSTAVLLNNIIDAKDPAKITLFKARGGAKDPTRTLGNLITSQKKAGAKPAADQVPWDKLDLPWKEFDKNPEPLQHYVAPEKIEARDPGHLADPGAAGRTSP